MYFKLLALILLSVLFVWDMLILYLQSRSSRNEIPENVKDLYSADEYLKWSRYMHEKTRLSMIRHIASFAVEFALLAFNIYAVICNGFNRDVYLQMFIAVLVNTLATTVISLPFDWYDTMKIEEKYGFNKSTGKTFTADVIKDLIIGLIISSGLGALYATVMGLADPWPVIILSAALILFIILLIFLSPLIQRLNNKFTPLEDGELKDKLTALLNEHGFKVRGIQVMDGSKRSTKANAFFAGFGKTKRIVLYDTLISSATTDEIVAVFAHELGHGLHRDTLKMIPVTALQMIVLAVLLFFTATGQVSECFGFSSINYGLCLILVMSIEFGLIAPLFGLLSNYLSRKAEYAADAQAVKEGYGPALISGLKRLHKDGFADISPLPLLIKLKYSHPTLSQRIAAIEKLTDGEEK
ncbi:MAG: hypothetical protein CW338_06055 [Clostridiales bacterium]|nr:hypothetical protein [Clostridiales bacterium]